MKKNIHAILILCFFSSLFGCALSPNQAPTLISKIEYAPGFYDKHPKSILVLPAINTTSAADAADQFRYTITKSLAEQGYYVFPIHLVDSFFKSENLPDAELISNIPVKKLKEIFQADAILFINIFNWDTDYEIASSSVDVGLSYSLIDANSEEEIWQGNIFSNSSLNASSNDAIIFLVSLIDVAVNSAVKYTDLATEANTVAANNFPYGVYRSDYHKDQNETIVISESTKPFVRGVYNPKIVGNQIRVSKSFVEDMSATSDMFGPPAPTGSLKLMANNNFVSLPYSKAHHVVNSDYLKHSDFNDYYYYRTENGKKYLRHRFFLYEENKPFFITENKKVFIHTDDMGKILYSKHEVTDFWTRPLIGEPIDYSFEIDRIVNLSSKL